MTFRIGNIYTLIDPDFSYLIINAQFDIKIHLIENRTDTVTFKNSMNPFKHINNLIKRQVEKSLFFFHLIQMSLIALL